MIFSRRSTGQKNINDMVKFSGKRKVVYYRSGACVSTRPTLTENRIRLNLSASNEVSIWLVVGAAMMNIFFMSSTPPSGKARK